MQELPRPAWYRRVWILNLAIAVVVVAVLVAATVVVGSARDERANPPMVTGAPPSITGGLSTTAPTQRALPQASPTTGALPRTTSTTKLGVVWEQSGTEPYSGGPSFEVPNGWHLVWRFDCHSFKEYGGGNFKISGEGALNRVSVQKFAVRGSGSETVAGGGRGRLVIETVCDSWTVKAVAP
ncbi:MAG TPA: hypothetical protein VGR74_20930 [Actinomycetota bacterium]|nr:hypothetical protein [Actinomycetota bacterium]